MDTFLNGLIKVLQLLNVLLHEPFALLEDFDFLFLPLFADPALAAVFPSFRAFDRMRLPEYPGEDHLCHVRDHRVLQQEIVGYLVDAQEQEGQFPCVLVATGDLLHGF